MQGHRDIRILRDDLTVNTIDLYQTLVEGKVGNTTLQDGDVILFGNVRGGSRCTVT